jgi:hypothetical protein
MFGGRAFEELGEVIQVTVDLEEAINDLVDVEIPPVR